MWTAESRATTTVGFTILLRDHRVYCTEIVRYALIAGAILERCAEIFSYVPVE